MTKRWMCDLTNAGIECIANEVEALRIAAQNEMFLSEDSSPAAVLDELQQLQIQLLGHTEELSRLNKFQRLFKVSCFSFQIGILEPIRHWRVCYYAPTEPWRLI